MKLNRITLILFIFCLLSVFIFSQEQGPEKPAGPDTGEIEGDPGISRMKGDQVFSFNAGLILPLFISDTSWNFEPGFDHLSLGGVGSLEWSGHLTNEIFLGGQISGMFAITPNARTLTMIPVCARAGYIFNLYPVTIPLTLGVGFSFNQLDGLFEFTPIIKPGATFLWNINYEWSVGLNLNYWWVPEVHIGDLKSQTRFGSFLETSFAASYYF